MIALIVAIFIVFTRLFRHLLYWNGLRMFQISAMINLKTKFEGFSNCSCANMTRTNENHEEFVRDRASCWHGNSHGNMYPRHKKNVNLQHCFFLRQFGSFRCNRLVLLFFYANVTVLMVRMKDDRFLQVVTEHVTIIWLVLFWSFSWPSFFT